MNIGKHFTLEEMTASETAARLGYPNVPGKTETASLTNLVTHILDPLREMIGKPIAVNSGFRSVAVNKAVGGVGDSQHCLGEAADIHVTGMTIGDLFAYIKKSGLPFDQLIDEFGSWVHVSYGPKNRRQTLTARTINGRTVYSAA